MTEQPNGSQQSGASRREFLKTSGVAVAGGVLAGSLSYARNAHAAANDDTIRIALIGCGGRGSGAAAQALSTKGNVKLVCMADAFQYKIDGAIRNISGEVKKGADGKDKEGFDVSSRIDVPKEMQFTGFDAYQKALSADNIDLVILATPPGFRPIHFEAAVKAGKNIFMEKPVATDANGVRKVLEATEESKKKNLKVGVGLQRRHQQGYIDTVKRIHDGAIGDIVATRVYWNGTRPWKHTREEVKRILGKDKPTEMEYQMVNWYYFTWLCGDHIVEQHIHNIDVSNWVKNGHPVKANGMGGSQIPRDKDDGEIFDHHAVEFEYADGSRMFSQCRHQRGAWGSVSEAAVGTKGTVSLNGYDIRPTEGSAWKYRGPNPNPYQVEHDDLFAAIREGRDYNEAEAGAHSTMTAILGRMATYGGKEITWDNALASKISLQPTEYGFEVTPPVTPKEDGMYAQAVPGLSKIV
jgi:myo-inositol 2-dehydrogenase/D-chiro-inositol 1-dehydrogenase